jgi:hypothetical protein
MRLPKLPAHTAHFLAFWSCLLASLWGANLAIERMALPDYGTWTGIRPLEDKLRKLEQFASEGPVDYLIFGSSIADHGVSAETLSQELEKHLGARTRVFNFSTGAASWWTFPMLYRLARTVTIPKAMLIIQPVERNYGDTLLARSPEAIMLEAPIGGVLRHDLRLRLSRMVWEWPLVRYASPIRDLALYGDFRNRKAGHADLYELSPYGDMLNYSYDFDPAYFAEQLELRAVDLAELAGLHEKSLTSEKRRRVYFSNTQISAIAELCGLLAQDRVSVAVAAHDRATGFGMGDNQSYRKAHEPYFRELEQLLGIQVLDFQKDLDVGPLETADSMHLNIHGARRFSELLAAALAGKRTPEKDAIPAPDLSAITPKNAGFNSFSAVLKHRGEQPGCWLDLKYVQTWQTPRLTPTDSVNVALRLPGNSDIYPRARAIAMGEVLVDLSGTPVSNSFAVARLLYTSGPAGIAISAPLARYKWLSCEQGQRLARSSGWPEVTVDRDSLLAGENVMVQWTGNSSPAADDWIGLFPASGDDRSRLHFIWTGGGVSGSLPFPVPAGIPDGDYDFRLFSHGTWRLLATTLRPVKIRQRPMGTELSAN